MVMLKVSNLIKLNRTVTVVVTSVTLATMLQNRLANNYYGDAEGIESNKAQ